MRKKNLIAKTDKEKRERERGNTILRWKSKFNFEEEKKKDYELETELYKQIRIQDPTLKWESRQRFKKFAITYIA